MNITQEMINEFTVLLEKGEYKSAVSYYDSAAIHAAEKGADESFSLGRFGVEAVKRAKAANVRLNDPNVDWGGALP